MVRRSHRREFFMIRPIRASARSIAIAGLVLGISCSSNSKSSSATVPATRAILAPLASIAPEQIDFKSLLGDPPADDADAHRQEVDLMLRLQDSRTPEDVRRCRAEEVVTVFAFATVLGSSFNPDDLPKTAA